MASRLHALVKHADDLHKVRPDRPIEDDMDRIGDRRLAAVASAVPDMQAAEAGQQAAAIDGRHG